MRWGVVRTASLDQPDTVRSSALAGTKWVRFGNETFVYGSAARLRAAGVDPAAEEVRAADLHLVRQKGRLFQAEHPNVPVLFDRGRFLVVALDRATVARIGSTDEPCFSIERLRAGTTVFETRPRSMAPATDVRSREIAGEVRAEALHADLSKLVSFPTRHSASPHFRDAADWAAQRLESLGYRTRIEPVRLPDGSESANVVASKATPCEGRCGRVLVTAHLDSVNHGGGVDASAPGADDNASGSAGLLEMARVLAPYSFKRELTFILFGGEEQGLRGSRQFVARLSAAVREQVKASINMDMIGSVNSPNWTVLLEGAPVSQGVMDALAAAAAAATALVVQTSLNPFASDHVPFIDEGLPGVLTIEGADSANDAIHSGGDTLDRVNPEFAAEVVRMNVAAVVTLAQFQGRATMVEPAVDPHPNRLLAGHLDHLHAQYARLNDAGRLSVDDFAAWQEIRQLQTNLRAGKLRH